MIANHSLFSGSTVYDWLQVMWHGMSLDCSVAGYLTIIPALLLIASIWIGKRWLRQAMRIYFCLAAFIVALLFVLNAALYSYWGFPLDVTPFFYFMSSPADAFASITPLMAIGGVLAIVVITIAVWMLFSHTVLAIHTTPVRRKILATVTMVMLTALLFLPIRGGVTVAAANTGKVFFSADMRKNHAAVNPVFSLMESIGHETDFSSQYRFMDDKLADKLFSELSYTASAEDIDTLFTTNRPDIYIIVLESFSSKLMKTLGGREDVAVNLDSLVKEGVLFTNFYANSFRTDRGLVAILSGYPAQPTTSIMKYPRKTEHLPSLAEKLHEAGYGNRYYYGGDANFTNMRSYLMAAGFQDIISDEDFPVIDRISKWGVPDHLVFRRVLSDLRKETYDKPMLRVIQTSSSHEPFDVPYHRLDNPALNAFAYTDSVVGNFIKEIKRQKEWEHTIVVLVPDHLGCWPENISNQIPERYQIPLLLLGGAIREPREVSVIGSQQDIAATLLSQLGLSHSDFTFSKDMLDRRAPHFAFFTVPDLFGMVTIDNTIIHDNQSGRVVYDSGVKKGVNLLPGKAYLQKLYDDLGRR